MKTPQRFLDELKRMENNMFNDLHKEMDVVTTIDWLVVSYVTMDRTMKSAVLLNNKGSRHV